MPLVVFLYLGGFYTIVETVNHDYTSKLALERIEKLVVTEKTFVRKTKLDVMDMLSDPFGLAQGDQFEATVWLAPSLVPYIDCRDWPSDRVTITKKEDGSALFHVITSGDFEFVRWIRYLGPEAVLLEPDWLVERVRKDLETACEQYAKKDTEK